MFELTCVRVGYNFRSCIIRHATVYSSRRIIILSKVVLTLAHARLFVDGDIPHLDNVQTMGQVLTRYLELGHYLPHNCP